MQQLKTILQSLCHAGLILLMLGIILPAHAKGDKAYYLYVAAESADEVDLVRFDGTRAEVVKRIAVGVWPVEIEGPHGLTVSPEGDYWYLSMAHGKPYGHVYKYSTGDDEVIGRVELDLFPATMQVSPSTGFLYVVNFNLHGDHVPSTVSVVDPESMTELERITTGVMPHGSRLSPDGLKHYSVAMMSGELFEIDALSLEISRKLYVGPAMALQDDAGHEGHGSDGDHHATGHGGHEGHDMDKMHHEDKDAHQGHGAMHHGANQPKPTWVFPHPDKPLVYIANNGLDEVVEVDLDAWRVTRRFSTPPGPYNVEVSPNGKLMGVTYKTAASTGIWDLASGKELARFDNTRAVSHGVIISPDSRYAFVSVEGKGGEPGAVDIIDLESLKMTTTVDVGKQAGGIAFWKIADE